MSMKRIFSLAMAATMLFSATAYGATVEQAADELNVPILTDKDTGKYSLPTYTTVTAGNEYMIWTVKGVHTQASQVSFGQSDVLYINQNTATATGVTFDAFLPMETEDSTVLVTGQGMAAPKIVGYIKGEENPKGSVSGNITSNLSDTDTITVELWKDGSVAYSTTTKGNSATYTFNGVAAGSYTMKVSKANHATREYAVTVVADVIIQDAKIHLLGDITGDGKLNVFDVGKANAHAKKTNLLTGYEFMCADVTEDGKVNVFDVGKMNAHAKKTNTLW